MGQMRADRRPGARRAQRMQRAEGMVRQRWNSPHRWGVAGDAHRQVAAHSECSAPTAWCGKGGTTGIDAARRAARTGQVPHTANAAASTAWCVKGRTAGTDSGRRSAHTGRVPRTAMQRADGMVCQRQNSRHGCGKAGGVHRAGARGRQGACRGAYQPGGARQSGAISPRHAHAAPKSTACMYISYKNAIDMCRAAHYIVIRGRRCGASSRRHAGFGAARADYQQRSARTCPNP